MFRSERGAPVENQKFIETISLFPELNRKLTDLLKSLSDEDCNHPTLFPHWKVRDIAVHLLDTSVRRLSSQRDNYFTGLKPTVSSYAELVRHVTALADRWCTAFSTVSPKIIITLVEEYQDQLYEFLKSLNPSKPAQFPGESESLNGFDIAREYTER